MVEEDSTTLSETHSDPVLPKTKHSSYLEAALVAHLTDDNVKLWMAMDASLDEENVRQEVMQVIEVFEETELEEAKANSMGDVEDSEAQQALEDSEVSIVESEALFDDEPIAVDEEVEEEAATTEASAKRVAASETTELSIPSEMKKLASKAVGVRNTYAGLLKTEKASSAKKASVWTSWNMRTWG